MIKLLDFWEASRTELRRVCTNEIIKSEFVLKNSDAEVEIFYPNRNSEIMVVLEGDPKEGV